ncbi:hypothetical protein ABBQ32_000819 [Trebouxia sp. C0010 RCD-2024]
MSVDVSIAVVIVAGNGYLANIPAGEFGQLYEDRPPSCLSGVELLHAYGEHYDQETQSHASLQLCGLTSPAADQLVGLVQKHAMLQQPGDFPKIYGAASVGHAGSGTVCILTAAGDTGQQAVSHAIQQFMRTAVGVESAQNQGSCLQLTACSVQHMPSVCKAHMRRALKSKDKCELQHAAAMLAVSCVSFNFHLD